MLDIRNNRKCVKAVGGACLHKKQHAIKRRLWAQEEGRFGEAVNSARNMYGQPFWEKP
jgi:hypothetical protein